MAVYLSNYVIYRSEWRLVVNSAEQRTSAEKKTELGRESKTNN